MTRAWWTGFPPAMFKTEYGMICGNGLENSAFLLVGDTIVVWRAWVLWEYHSVIQWTLVILGICNAVVNIADSSYTAESVIAKLPASTPRAVAGYFYLIFSLALNIVAVMLIAYKTRIHSAATKALCTDENSNKRSPSFNVLVFLVESGATFCILQPEINMLTVLGRILRNNNTWLNLHTGIGYRATLRVPSNGVRRCL
ncbi:hypothetical protein BDP27DRAFT_1368987 [Rhodocollybia butyracea]|uniref:Uncharacterized protein n=1 Tax=Rhodocollybia butyracea TaxID=206335 RepID=A0A9P5PB22_9AGAR|nr:hypothetical protein BDP27DRAFT_1368987 [Rhodocollybia butyracea]